MTTRDSLNPSRLRHHLVDNGPYAEIRHTTDTGSTNTDLVAAAHDGAPAYTALFTEHQSAGRGRHGRPWVAPQGSQLTFSVLIRPPAQALERLGLLPLMTGLAINDALHEVPDLAGLDIALKWPNDVLVDGRKLCGILGEAVALGDQPALVMGVGLNVSLTEEELPVPHATSLDLAAAAHGKELTLNRTDLAVTVLKHLHTRLEQFSHGTGQPLVDYRAACSSIGQEVNVHLPDHTTLHGTVTDVDNSGHIVVADSTGTTHSLSAGDVTHLRRADGGYSTT